MLGGVGGEAPRGASYPDWLSGSGEKCIAYDVALICLTARISALGSVIEVHLALLAQPPNSAPPAAGWGHGFRRAAG